MAVAPALGEPMAPPPRSLRCRAEYLSWADGSNYDSDSRDFVPPVKPGMTSRLQLTMVAAELIPASGSGSRLAPRNLATAEYEAEGVVAATKKEKTSPDACLAYDHFLLEAGLPITVTVYKGSALRAGLREGGRFAVHGILEATAYLYWRVRPGGLITARIGRITETLSGDVYLDLEDVDVWRGWLRPRLFRTRPSGRAGDS